MTVWRLALILAHEDGARLESPCQLGPSFVPARVGIQEPCGRAIEPTKSIFLQPVGNHSRDQILGQSRWRHGPEGQPPAHRSASTPSDLMRSISTSIASGSTG